MAPQTSSAAMPVNGRTSTAKPLQAARAAIRPADGLRSTARAATMSAQTVASDVLCER